MVTQLLLIDPRDLEAGPAGATARRSVSMRSRPASSATSTPPHGARAGRRRGPARSPSGPASGPASGAASGRPAGTTPDVPATAGPSSSPGGWRLDDRTREIGRRGIEDARRALAAAVERVDGAADRTAA